MIVGLITKFLGGKLFESILSDTTATIANKILGSDKSPEVKIKEIEALTNYKKSTAHESPTRRIIAWAIVFLYLALIVFYVVNISLGYYLDLESTRAVAGRLFTLLSTLKEPFMLICGFYFAGGLIKYIKSK